ncbi:MAG: hypothetical protein R3E01_26285 [Pirellulaceae bacterium]
MMKPKYSLRAFFIGVFFLSAMLGAFAVSWRDKKLRQDSWRKLKEVGILTEVNGRYDWYVTRQRLFREDEFRLLARVEPPRSVSLFSVDKSDIATSEAKYLLPATPLTRVQLIDISFSDGAIQEIASRTKGIEWGELLAEDCNTATLRDALKRFSVRRIKLDGERDLAISLCGGFTCLEHLDITPDNLPENPWSVVELSRLMKLRSFSLDYVALKEEARRTSSHDSRKVSLDSLPNLIEFNLNYRSATPLFLKIESCPELSRVSLDCESIGSESWDAIERLEDLKALSLTGFKEMPTRLSEVGRNLTRIEFHFCELDDDTINTMQGLPSLNHVTIDHCSGVSSSDLAISNLRTRVKSLTVSQ